MMLVWPVYDIDTISESKANICWTLEIAGQVTSLAFPLDKDQDINKLLEGVFGNLTGPQKFKKDCKIQIIVTPMGWEEGKPGESCELSGIVLEGSLFRTQRYSGEEARTILGDGPKGIAERKPELSWAIVNRF
jgi:hypothetical protein